VLILFQVKYKLRSLWRLPVGVAAIRTVHDIGGLDWLWFGKTPFVVLGVLGFRTTVIGNVFPRDGDIFTWGQVSVHESPFPGIGPRPTWLLMLRLTPAVESQEEDGDVIFLIRSREL
jgi:hypothetical protein